MESSDFVRSTSYYLGKSFESVRMLWEVITNSGRILKGTYRFENFDEYIKQLSSDKQEDKKEEYWKSAYYELLMDYIRISIAFENYNKVVLIRKGYLIHNINKSFSRPLLKKQNLGFPIATSEFISNIQESFNEVNKENILKGLNIKLHTIKYSDTLNDNYQDIIGLDKQFVFELKKINKKRNRLHFYLDYHGANQVDRYIRQWNFIKQTAFEYMNKEQVLLNKEYDSSILD